MGARGVPIFLLNHTLENLPATLNNSELFDRFLQTIKNTMPKTLRQRALDLLSRREHTRSELQHKLAPYATEAHELHDLLDDLAQRGWQSDRRFTEQYIRLRATRYGMQRIAQELKQKGVAGSLIREVSAESDDDGYATAYAQWQRKFGALPATPQDRARQIRFLASRGFSQTIIQRIIRGEWQDADGEY